MDTKFKALEPQWCVLPTGCKDIPIVNEQGVVVAVVLSRQARQGAEVIEAVTRYAEAKELLAAGLWVLEQLPASKLSAKTMLFLIEEFLRGSTASRTQSQPKVHARLQETEALIVKLEAAWDTADDKCMFAEVQDITRRLVELREEQRRLKGQVAL